MATTSRAAPGDRHGWMDFSRAARAVPSPILQGMMAAALLCALLPAMAKALHPQPWFAAPLHVGALLPLGAALDPSPTRCAGCGVVESIRALDHVDGAPARYEFNVRLRDGSLRTSTTDGTASWRVGDAILLVGGSPRP